jgi:hypothetical protein
MAPDRATLDQDKNLSCIDCRKMFTWSVGEQEYYAQKNFSQPKRCPDCRQRRREEKERQG